MRSIAFVLAVHMGLACGSSAAIGTIGSDGSPTPCLTIGPCTGGGGRDSVLEPVVIGVAAVLALTAIVYFYHLDLTHGRSP